mgnify:CR=1 FL=1|tara:strand:- start:3894 stop:6200 length:2307 start_codon:yes stop_codon:yes gene_type:complete
MAIPSKDKYTHRILHSDVEARGFLDVVKTSEDVWCICSRDDETDEVFLFHDYPEFDNAVVVDDGIEYTIPPRTGTLLEGVRFWYLAGKNGSRLSIHNTQTYDRLLIERIWKKCIIPEEVWWDTFIQSKVQWFDRPQKRGAKSAHGLLNYSLMQGHKKPPVEDFTKMNAFMLHRCIVDTKTQKYCYQYLKVEAAKLSKLGIDFTEALKIENEYARGCAFQELAGVLADVPHMKKCIEDWDERTEILANKIEPILPPTIKVNSTKIPRSELMRILGYTNIPPDETEEVTRAGETKVQPVKPYYKPSVNFHKVEKVNSYSGFNISYGASPRYTKKKDLTAWIKSNHPDTKPKDWDIEKVVIEDKVLNASTCKYFEVEPEDTDIICAPHTKVGFSPSKLTQHDAVKAYLIRYAGLKSVEEWNLKKDSDGQFVRADKTMVVSYPHKAAPENQLHMRIKAGSPIVTSPKVGEKDYDQITGDIGKEIGEYNTTIHRRRFLSNPKDPEHKGLLAYVREDGRLPCGVNNFATSTSRSSHRVWVNAAGEGALHGEAIRNSLIAPEGRVLVGCDMKSAQLGIAAYYANNFEYYDAVASGQEVVKDENGKEVYVGESAHCFNARAFTLVSEEEWKEAIRSQDPTLIHSIALRRKKSKGGSFATIFGASGKKVATTLDIPEHLGEEKKNAFLANIGLDGVVSHLKQSKKKYKRGNGWYIPLPFGYWIFCKSDHKSINYIIQGTEAACQKVAVNYFEKELLKREYDAFKVLDYHKQHCGLAA